MAKKTKKFNVAEKFVVLFIGLFAAGLTFGFPFASASNSAGQGQDKPQTKAANTYITTEIDFEDAPFKKTTVYDSSLAKGVSIVTIKGVNGKKTVTYRVVHQDDIITSRDVVSEEITQKPVDEVTTTGTYIVTTSQHKVLGATTTKTDPQQPDPTPPPPPPPTCTAQQYLTILNDCAPINAKGVKATGLCVNNNHYTYSKLQSSCDLYGGVKEWYIPTT